MPEGVEVKISADIIKPIMVGKTIKEAIATTAGRYKSTDPEGYVEFNKHLPAQVTDIQTKGKFMYWTFDNGWYLFSTFGMTGQWSPQQGKHPCFFFSYLDGQENKSMFFNDPRHFGTIKFVRGEQALREKLGELGWDPLARSIQEYDAFIHSHLRVSKKPIGELLMDQGFFAGVGNYIRAEALYLSKLSPWRPGNSLTSQEIDSLQESIVQVMKDSYDHQGATILTYKDAFGAEGKYSSCFKVYGQKVDPLGNKIKKETGPDGRTIHWSPTVQV